MANPCDRRVQQLTVSLNNLVKAVADLNAQVTAQSLEIDEAVQARNVAWLAADGAEARVLEKQAHIDMQTQVIENQQNEIARLQALVTEPQPEPEPSNIQPDNVNINVTGGEGGFIRNEPGE